ncbi:hypothetical protein Tco_1144220 [Tanacetum coccineum]
MCILHLSIGPDLVQETTEKISQIKDRLKVARDCQKSYADKRRKPREFSVGDYVLLKVSALKVWVRFGKKERLAPRFFKPFEIVEKVGPVAYRLDLLEVLNGVHDTFHVSNLKKCLADPTLQVPLDEIQVDAKLNFVEDPVEILETEFKKLKCSRIATVKILYRVNGGDFVENYGNLRLEDEETEAQGRKVQADPQDSSIQGWLYSYNKGTDFGLDKGQEVQEKKETNRQKNKLLSLTFKKIIWCMEKINTVGEINAASI